MWGESSDKSGPLVTSVVPGLGRGVALELLATTSEFGTVNVYLKLFLSFLMGQVTVLWVTPRRGTRTAASLACT